MLTLVNDFSQMMKLVKSNVLLTKYSVLAPLRQSDREGEAKVEAQLLAVTTDNYIHTRPLCTAADLSLAMFELMDPKIFKAGLIHMPNLIPPKYERFTHGFYRFIYQLSSSDCSWQYIRYVAAQARRAILVVLRPLLLLFSPLSIDAHLFDFSLPFRVCALGIATIFRPVSEN